MKKCPFCAEEIQDAAIVCKHCGRDVPALAATVETPPVRPARTSVTSWLGLLVFGIGTAAVVVGGSSMLAGSLGVWLGLGLMMRGSAVIRFGGSFLLSALFLAVLGSLVEIKPSTGSGSLLYRVSGTAARVSLTYATPGGTEQLASVPLPWSYSMPARRGAFGHVAAQILDERGGTVTAEIVWNGDVVKSATSSGFAQIAAASGRVE